MYTKFYALREKPFNLTPDPRFLYLSESHKEALAHLKYGVQERKGFIALTGEVGTGKTTLLHALINGLDGNVKTIFMTNSNLSIPGFYHFVSSELGLPYTKGKSNFLVNFKGFLQSALSRDEIFLLIIDEAQNLSFELLEEVRLLSNLETPSAKLLQIFLVGQQELNDKLNMVNLRQLKQRISIKYHIRPLGLEDTKKYIQHRLYLAGSRNRELFPEKAIKRIYTYSKGLPRLINIICDHALLTGYVREERKIGDSVIKEVIQEMESSYPTSQTQNAPEKSHNTSIIPFILAVGMVLYFLRWLFLGD